MLVIKVYMEYNMRENGMHMSLKACALNIWEAQIKKNYRQKKRRRKKRVTCMNDGGSYLNDFYLHKQ